MAVQSQNLITRKTSLSANIVQFCRFLREKGLPNGPAEEADALRAMAILPPEDPELLRDCLRAILTRSRRNQVKFDELYDEYWRNLDRAVDSKVKDGKEEKPQAKPKQKAPSIQALKSWLHGNKEEEEQTLATYSATGSLIHKDFSAFGTEELSEVMKLIQQFARMLATQYQRRYRAAKKGQKLDLRRTLRLNLRRGGEILELAFRKRRVRKMKMVVLCDVSKSMDLYSRFLMQFLYAFQNVYRRIETFVFGTRLQRITESLREREFSGALEKLSDQVNDWSGGTRIGFCLKYFVDTFGERLVDQNTIVLILSDGWDTGELAFLEEAMIYLHKKAHKVVWLNPLAGNPNFEPSVKGMATALPYIDLFASAHNLDSLRKAIKAMSR
ncbi:MAG: VWA domain-containing protein [Bacteroidota bacterium]